MTRKNHVSRLAAPATLALAAMLAAGPAGAQVERRDPAVQRKVELVPQAELANRPARAATVLEGLTKSPDHDILLQLVRAAGLEGALGSSEGQITLFAPTNEAFAKLGDAKEVVANLSADPGSLKALLSYHVAEGRIAPNLVRGREAVELQTLHGEPLAYAMGERGQTVNGVTITRSAAAASGVLHSIGTVLELPAPPDKTIVELATEAGNFTTLLQAVDAAGLTETFAREGSYTLFAPTDEAFAKLGDEAIQNLLNDPVKLTSVLRGHVVEGGVRAAKAVSAGKATTLEGTELVITEADGRVTVNGAGVIAPNLRATNGIVHAVDTVIVP